MARAAQMIVDEFATFAEAGKKKSEVPSFDELGSRGEDLQVSSDGKLEDTDEITHETYQKMRTDPQVKACLLVIKLPILQTAKTVQAESEEGQLIAKWANAQLHNMDDSLEYYMREILTGLDFGRSITEKVWALRPTAIDPDDENSTVQDRIVPEKLKTYNPANISIKLDPKTLKLVGAVQTVDKKEVLIPAKKLMIYSHEKEFGNYNGESALRAAYKPWVIKEFLQRFWNIALERYGSPFQTMEIPQSGSLSKAIELMDLIKSKSGIPLPEGYKHEIHDLANTGMSFKEAIEYQDVMIARAMLIPDLVFSNSDSGAYSLSKTHSDFFQMRLNAISQEVADLFTKYLIKPLVRYNYGEVREFPNLHIDKVGDEDMKDLSEIIKSMIGGNVIAPSEDWIRERLGFPQPDDEAKEYLEAKHETSLAMAQNKANGGGEPNPIDDKQKVKDKQTVKKKGKEKNDDQVIKNSELVDYYSTNLRTSVRGLLKLGIGEE